MGREDVSTLKEPRARSNHRGDDDGSLSSRRGGREEGGGGMGRGNGPDSIEKPLG